MRTTEIQKGRPVLRCLAALLPATLAVGLGMLLRAQAGWGWAAVPALVAVLATVLAVRLLMACNNEPATVAAVVALASLQAAVAAGLGLCPATGWVWLAVTLVSGVAVWRDWRAGSRHRLEKLRERQAHEIRVAENRIRLAEHERNVLKDERAHEIAKIKLQQQHEIQTMRVEVQRQRLELMASRGVPALPPGVTDALVEDIPYARTAARSCREPVVLGMDADGGAVAVLLKGRHVLVAGATDSGKSGLMKLLALRLAACEDAVLVGIDLKPGAPELSQVRPLLAALAKDAEQARALFIWLECEAARRGALMTSRGIDDWDTEDGPEIFVFVDEAFELQRQGDRVPKGERKMSERTETALAMWRAFGIHLVMATQQPSNRVFGGTTDPRGNLGCRICFRVDERDHARFTFGSDTAWNPLELELPGSFLLRDREHKNPVVCRAEFVKPCLSAEVEQLAGERPDFRVILPPGEGGKTGERLVRLLAEYGALTRAELIEGTGAEWPAIREALRRLQEAGRVQADGERYRLAPEEPVGLTLVKGEG
ncbi:FtsK/SpoIIIE domain-containing protein [Streptomyces sp. NPDC047117]|uniref:FtsK/SpoIIIE domain-containing protein n=1 Tax=Streptomyces sp. NPDC047117 TaxID=3155379 RepID=UPI0033F3E0F8